jgi:hypothetical protein
MHHAPLRDKHLSTIAKRGRMSWQRTSGNNRRCLVETTTFRYKTVISRRLHSNQRTEAINRMSGLGMPICGPIR